METKTQDWVSDIYWYSIIKNILSESKQYLFTTEIWEKMKDEHGYPYNKERVEKELLNLQRTGYVIPIVKKEKQAWMYPTDDKLRILERNSIIDSEITTFITTFNRMPTETELLSKLYKSIDRLVVSERLAQLSKLTDSIDMIIKKSCEDKTMYGDAEIKISSDIKPTCDDQKEMFFYETTVNNLDGGILDIDFLMIIKIIDARKKYLIS